MNKSLIIGMVKEQFGFNWIVSSLEWCRIYKFKSYYFKYNSIKLEIDSQLDCDN